MKRFFNYISAIWEGRDKQPSIRRILAIMLSIHFIHIVNKSLYIFNNFIQNKNNLDAGLVASVGSTIANIAMIVGIEAGLIAALLALTTYQAFQAEKIDIGKHKDEVNNFNNVPQFEG
jgi:hypothetical protein